MPLQNGTLGAVRDAGLAADTAIPRAFASSYTPKPVVLLLRATANRTRPRLLLVYQQLGLGRRATTSKSGREFDVIFHFSDSALQKNNQQHSKWCRTRYIVFNSEGVFTFSEILEDPMLDGVWALVDSNQIVTIPLLSSAQESASLFMPHPTSGETDEWVKYKPGGRDVELSMEPWDAEELPLGYIQA